SSSRRTTRTSAWKISSASSGVFPWKCCTSTPPVNARPSARRTSARTVSDSASSSAPSRSAWSSGVHRLSGGESTTTTPTSPSRSKPTCRSATQLGGYGCQLVRTGLMGPGWQLERIVRVTRNRVDVEVEHGLPGRRAARVEQVHPVAVEALLLHTGEPLSAGGRGREIRGRDLDQVRGVVARDHERMPPSPWVDVH